MDCSVITPFQRKTKEPVGVVFEFPGRWNRGQRLTVIPKVQDHYANVLCVSVCICMCLCLYACVWMHLLSISTFVETKKSDSCSNSTLYKYFIKRSNHFKLTHNSTDYDDNVVI